MADRAVAARLLVSALTELDVAWEALGDGAYLASLPTVGRPSTEVWLAAGDHGVLVESLFVRAPVRRRETVLAALLARNLRSRGVSFALDSIGDVYLTGLLPYAALSTDEIDAVLGQIVAHVDEAWVQVVSVGFGADADARKWALSGAGRRASGGVVATPDADPRR